MKNSSDDMRSNRSKFENARAWELPTVSGVVANPRSDSQQHTNIDEVKSFDQKIREHLRSIKQQREVSLLTVEQIEAVQKQAYEEGRKEGYDAGRKQLQQHSKQLLQALSSLNKPLADSELELEQQLTEMVFSIARNLIRQELKVNHEPVLNLVHQTLDMMPVKSREIRVRLNPADIELLRENGVDPDSQDWQIIADENLAAGGCVVETESTRIDASMEQRIAGLVDDLFNGLHEPAVTSTAEPQSAVDIEIIDDSVEDESGDK